MVPADYKFPVIAILTDGRLVTVGISLGTAKRIWDKKQAEDIEYRSRQPIVAPVCFKHLLVSLPIARLLEN